RFGMSDCNPVVLPIDPNQHLSRESAGNPIEPSTYQQIVGSLMYLLTATRPDLAFTITFLSQFNNCANSTHLNAVKRVQFRVKIIVTPHQKWTFAHPQFRLSVNTAAPQNGRICKYFMMLILCI